MTLLTLGDPCPPALSLISSLPHGWGHIFCHSGAGQGAGSDPQDLHCSPQGLASGLSCGAGLALTPLQLWPLVCVCSRRPELALYNPIVATHYCLIMRLVSFELF